MNKNSNISDKFDRTHWIGVHTLNNAELVKYVLTNEMCKKKDT